MNGGGEGNRGELEGETPAREGVVAAMPSSNLPRGCFGVGVPRRTGKPGGVLIRGGTSPFQSGGRDAGRKDILAAGATLMSINASGRPARADREGQARQEGVASQWEYFLSGPCVKSTF